MAVDRYALVKIPFLGAGLYLIFVALFSSPIADYDLWGYLSFGRIFWEESYFPYQDVFSYTPTKTIWVYHEWLTGVCLYFIYKYSGGIPRLINTVCDKALLSAYVAETKYIDSAIIEKCIREIEGLVLA